MTATPDYLAGVALELSYRVREDDPEANGRWLAKRLPDPADRWALIFVIAAAVPQDRTWHELTDWVSHPPVPRPDEPERPQRSGRDNLQPCGTRAAYRRHLKHDEPTCKPCKAAAARYKRNFASSRRAA